MRRVTLGNRYLALLAAMLVAIAISTPVVAQQPVYKWTDENGVVHFSDTPPEDSVKVQTGTIEASPPPPSTSPALVPSRATESATPTAQPLTTTAPAPEVVKDLSTMSLDELDRRCDVAREQKIAPLRAAEIEKCKADRRNDPGWCERFNVDYGEGGRTISGSIRPRMFDDLPECVEALNERNRRGAQNRNTR